MGVDGQPGQAIKLGGLLGEVGVGFAPSTLPPNLGLLEYTRRRRRAAGLTIPVGGEFDAPARRLDREPAIAAAPVHQGPSVKPPGVGDVGEDNRVIPGFD